MARLDIMIDSMIILPLGRSNDECYYSISRFDAAFLRPKFTNIFVWAVKIASMVDRKTPVKVGDHAH